MARNADLDERINAARLAGTMHKNSGFIYDEILRLFNARLDALLATLGIDETSLQATSCETTPEPPCSGRKIIPFPGVTIDQGDRFQNGLDDFLREMGYIE